MKIFQSNAGPHSKCSVAECIAISMVCFSLVFSPVVTNAGLTTLDAALTSAILIQNEAIKDMHKERKSLREATLAAQAAINLTLGKIHDIQDKILGYMENASGVLTNLSQLKNIVEYTVKIPDQLTDLVKTIPNNPKGAAITAIVSKRVAETVTDVTGLATLIANLVQSNYSFGEGGNNGGKKHVNLLSSAERFNILLDVETKLKHISMDIRMLKYYVETLSWRDLWMGLDRASYVKLWNSRWEINSIINKWNKLSNKH